MPAEEKLIPVLRIDEETVLLARLNIILNGIDKEESESEKGWWETSTGAKFGAEKKAEIIELFKEVIKNGK